MKKITALVTIVFIIIIGSLYAQIRHQSRIYHQNKPTEEGIVESKNDMESISTSTAYYGLKFKKSAFVHDYEDDEFYYFKPTAEGIKFIEALNRLDQQMKEFKPLTI